MRNEEILEPAVTSVLDRDADQTTSAVETVEDQLRQLHVDEKGERRIYHDSKLLTMLLGMILAAPFLLASFGVDPNVGNGGALKIALCILGQVVNALLPVVLCCLEGKPRAQKIVSCLSFLPAILENWRGHKHPARRLYPPGGYGTGGENLQNPEGCRRRAPTGYWWRRAWVGRTQISMAIPRPNCEARGTWNQGSPPRAAPSLAMAPRQGDRNASGDESHTRAGCPVP